LNQHPPRNPPVRRPSSRLAQRRCRQILPRDLDCRRHSRRHSRLPCFDGSESDFDQFGNPQKNESVKAAAGISWNLSFQADFPKPVIGGLDSPPFPLLTSAAPVLNWEDADEAVVDARPLVVTQTLNLRKRYQSLT
jgi:hypothetical protein